MEEITKQKKIRYVDAECIKWLVESALNLATITLIPYTTDGYAYFFMSAEYSKIWIEERGMYVDKACIDMIFNLLMNGQNIDMSYFEEPREAIQTNNFQLEVFERLIDSGNVFVRKFGNTERSDSEIFQGHFKMPSFGIVKISTIKTPDLDEIIRKYRSRGHESTNRSN